MLPEQIWDAPDIPELGLRLGKPTGAAMPLVWAHAEYVKLLRSVTDGQVFDRISVVAERYGAGRRPSGIEIFRLERPVESMPAGSKLRFVANDHFSLVWTVDDWQTVRHLESHHVGCAGHFADMETDPGQAGRLIFAIKWRLHDRWEGRNFEVLLEPTENQETAYAGASSEGKSRV
jgi:glucoamylase